MTMTKTATLERYLEEKLDIMKTSSSAAGRDIVENAFFVTKERGDCPFSSTLNNHEKLD